MAGSILTGRACFLWILAYVLSDVVSLGLPHLQETGLFEDRKQYGESDRKPGTERKIFPQMRKGDRAKTIFVQFLAEKRAFSSACGANCGTRTCINPQ